MSTPELLDRPYELISEILLIQGLIAQCFPEGRLSSYKVKVPENVGTGQGWLYEVVGEFILWSKVVPFQLFASVEVQATDLPETYYSLRVGGREFEDPHSRPGNFATRSKFVTMREVLKE